MYRIITDTPIADTLGFSTVGISIGMSILEWFTMINVNEALHFLASAGGLCFLFYKIKNLRFELKVKKEEYKRLKKDNEEKV